MRTGSFRVAGLFAVLLALVLAGCSDNDDRYVEVRRQPTPIQVTLAQPASSASAGWAHTCAVLADNTMRCWGGNQYGQLGNNQAALVTCVEGYSVCSDGPVAVTGTTQWTAAAGGYLMTCGLSNTQSAFCWGAGRRGQLGTGVAGGSSVPLAVSGGLTFSQLSAAKGGDLVCGISGTALWCWGTGYDGQPGTGGVVQTALEPYRVAPASSFTAVSVGEVHACALDNTGASNCWGSNGFGQVGDGTTTNRTLPTVVLGGRTYAQIVTGLAHTCARDAGGVAYCWGATEQIGRATTTAVERATPTAVSGAQVFAQIAAGGWHTCGLDAAGQLWCWGDNSYSQFGDGGTASSLLPRRIDGLPLFAQITAGGAHTCGITAAGAVHCWGANTYGQAGRLP
jgi:alpha-tubulin suppressor-like RCC1 family protein